MPKPFPEFTRVTCMNFAEYQVSTATLSVQVRGNAVPACLSCPTCDSWWCVLKEREAAEAQAELERRAAESAAKEEEARQLEEELRRTRLEMEEKQQALQEALSTPQQLHVHDHEEQDDDQHSHSMILTCAS